MTRGPRRSARGSLVVLCAMYLLVGAALGHRHGGGWIGDLLPTLPERGAASTAPAPTAGTAAPPAADRVASSTAAVTVRAPRPAMPSAPTAPIVVTAVGDTMMGSRPLRLPPGDGASLFSAVRPLLDGDVVMLNLEGTLSTATTSKCAPDAEPSECFAFQTPPSYASRLTEAGFNVANLANNHSNDFGAAGRNDTVAALEEAGLAHTGLRDTVAHVDVRGSRVAVLGFAPYDWADPLLDIDAAAARVAEARDDADVVVVTFHGGAEGTDHAHVPEGPESHLGERRGDLRAFARAVIDAGADLVVGHGPHVLRGMEVYRDRLVAHSLGNFAGYGGAFNLTGALSVSMVLRVALNPDGTLRRARVIPVVLTADGTPAPGGDAVSRVRQLSLADFGADAPRIGDDGMVRPR